MTIINNDRRGAVGGFIKEIMENRIRRRRERIRQSTSVFERASKGKKKRRGGINRERERRAKGGIQIEERKEALEGGRRRGEGRREGGRWGEEKR